MPTVELQPHSDFWDWQPVARYLLANDIEPNQVSWNGGAEQDLFACETEVLTPETVTKPKSSVKVSQRFVDLARMVASHSSAERFDLLYRLLWRIQHGEKSLLANPLDGHMHRAQRLAKEVSRDRHKMRAFVRFREVRLKDVNSATDTAGANTENNLFIAWFEPEHFILRLNSDFFCRRFHNMNWSIVSPYQSIHWQDKQLYLGAGADPSQVPQDDALEDYWRCYYANIFNPARLKIKAMCSEMPKKYWHNLPEAQLIPQLIKTSGQRTQAMLDAPTHGQGRLPDSTRFNRDQWLQQKYGEVAEQTQGYFISTPS